MTSFLKYIPVLFGGDGGGGIHYGDVTPNESDFVPDYYYLSSAGKVFYYSNDTFTNTPNIHSKGGDIVNVKCITKGLGYINCFEDEQTNPQTDLPFAIQSIPFAESTDFTYTLPQGTNYFTVTLKKKSVQGATITLSKG